MTKEEFRQLLDKRLKGKCSPEELEFLENLSESFYRKNQTEVFLSEEEKEQVYRELYQRVRPRSRVVFRPMRIAASLVLFAGLGFLAMYMFRTDSLESSLTSAGELREIRLDDGTTVQLGPESSLKYPAEFGEKERTVYLTGQAYFEVERDSSRPFTVHSGKVETTVLGTAFDISAYEEDSLTAVSLVHGSVRVRGKGEAVILTPGQQARFIPDKKEADIREFNRETVLAWTKNELIFRRITFRQLARVLKRQYGIQLVFEHPDFNTYTISGSFKEPRLEEVLSAVSKAKKLDYKQIDGETYLIYQPD